jgi:hypothetical protein
LSQNTKAASTGSGAALGETIAWQDLMSEPGETRTLDPRIKSALLYRLSYRLIKLAGTRQ